MIEEGCLQPRHPSGPAPRLAEGLGHSAPSVAFLTSDKGLKPAPLSGRVDLTATGSSPLPDWQRAVYGGF